MEVTIEKKHRKASIENVADHFSDKHPTNSVCPVRDILARVSDKWSMHTIILLGKSEKLRFTELKKGIEGISQRMLTVTLRALEEDGFLVREIFPEIPPRVEYRLTELGRSLLQQLMQLSDWANQNMQEVLKQRKRYSKK
jgi:DNA-binding HxlR family transcriptional regulator